MKQRWMWAALAVLVLGSAGFFLYQRASPRRGQLPPELSRGAAAGFNLLLITLDTTRPDHLGCYGSKAAQTPVLDALARGGLLVTDAVTTVPTTLPAHASLLTGLYPPNHGVRRNGEYRLAEEKMTLAELLREQGYETAAFVSAFVLDARFGLNQGFDIYDDKVTPSALLNQSDTLKERTAGTVTDAAIEWIETRGTEKPFFAWVHYFDPHYPWAAPEPFAGRFPQGAYDAEIAYMDSEIGRLLISLEKRKITQRTLVVALGDHGEGLGEHGEAAHDFFIYESVMRVPFILSCPGLFQGPQVLGERTVSLVDLVPTTLELLGLAAPPSIDGISLAQRQVDADRAIYMESLAPYTDYAWAPLFGLRRHDFKYIRAPQPELYDLVEDPAEQRNLEPVPHGRALAARDRMQVELEEMLAGWEGVEAAAAEARADSAEVLARLQSLGYMGGISPAPGEGRLDPKQMLPLYNKVAETKKLASSGQVQPALAALQEVAAAAPRSRSILGQMAALYVVLGQLPQAEQALRESIAIKPHAATLVLLGQILVAGQRYSEAKALADEALRMDPSNGLAFIIKGDVAAAEGRLAESKELYYQAAVVDPYRTGPAFQQRLQAQRQRASAPAVPAGG